MKTHNFDQGTDEWFEIRKGKMTGSNARAIGNVGKGLETYITNLMAEYYSTGERDNYTNLDMQRGNELEDQAREIYSLENDIEVEQVGFIEYSKFVGCSPDGLTKDGGIEVKCPNDSKYFQLLIGEQEIDSGYIWQIQMNMLISGKKWFDFVAYNPHFEQSTIVKRIKPDKKKVDKLLEGFKIGEKRIKDIMDKYNKL